MLSAAIRSCMLVLGVVLSSCSMLLWPVRCRMCCAFCSQLAMRAVSLISVADVNPNPPLLMVVNSLIFSSSVNCSWIHCS